MQVRDGFEHLFLGVFTDSGQVLGAGFTYSVALGDVDGDGDIDGDGDGECNGVDDVDVNMDGDCNFDLDIVAGNSEGHFVWPNNGAGVFTDSGQVLGTSSAYSVALGDVDADGHLDLMTGNTGANLVLLNNGGGLFTEIQALDSNTRVVTLGDLDGDGDLDHIESGSGSLRSTVWLNDF